MSHRLVIVEDHGLIAHTVASALRVRGAEVEIIAADEIDAIIDDVIAADPDLAMLDLDLGDGMTALDLLPSLAAADVPSLVVTGVHDPVRRAECVAAGAIGVLTKHGSFDDLVAAVDRALDGEPLMTRHEREEHLGLLRDHHAAETARLAPFRELTPREAAVLAGLMQGQSVEQIASSAVVSVTTVRSQVRAILRKLQVSSQLSAIARANEAGWVPPTTVSD